MKVIVSACLLGENCKYNGGNNESAKLKAYLDAHHFEVIAVCPEVLGGLPTPRVPAEITAGAVMTRDGRNVDAAFRLGAQKALELAKKEGADCAILQSRSPSCGVKQVYDGTFSGTRIPGRGIFAQLLAENGIPALDIEDLE